MVIQKKKKKKKEKEIQCVNENVHYFCTLWRGINRSALALRLRRQDTAHGYTC